MDKYTFRNRPIIKLAKTMPTIKNIISHLSSINNHIFYMNNSVTYLDYLQHQSHEKLQRILKLPAPKQVKILMIQSLMHSLRQIYNATHYNEPPKNYANFDQLSTSISQCHSASIHFEKDLQQLQQRIIQLQKVKFENNDEIETNEEELCEMDKIVKVKREYDEHLNKKIEATATIQQSLPKRQISQAREIRGKTHSILNKGLDKVANILNIDKWWK